MTQEQIANFILFVGGALSAIVSGAIVGVPTFLLWLRSSKQNQSLFENLIKGAFASAPPELLQTVNDLTTALSQATDTIEGLKSSHQDFLDRNATTDSELVAALSAYRSTQFATITAPSNDFEKALALAQSEVSKESFDKALATVRATTASDKPAGSG